MGIEQTIWRGLCLISASVYQRSKNSCSRRVKEWERGGVSWGRWFGGWGCFVGRFSVGCANLRKSSKFCGLPSIVLSLLFRPPTSFCRSTVYVYANMRAVSVCVANPPNYDMDYRIFNVPTWPSNAFVYTHVSVCLYLFHKTEWLSFSKGEEGVRGPFFFGGGGAWTSFIKS